MVLAVAIGGVLALMPVKMVVAVSIRLGSHLILEALNGGGQLRWPKKEGS